MNRLIIGLGSLLLLLTACSSEEDLSNRTPEEWKRIELSDNTRAAAKDLKDFYVSFTTDAVRYADSSDDSESKNVVVSPLSAYILLAMVANGVDSDVQKEITEYLGSSDIESLNELASILLTELPKTDKTSDVRIANSVWIHNRLNFSDEYVSILDSYYAAEKGSLDFSGNSKKALTTLNTWCSKHTDGLINRMFDKIDPATLAVLLNAMYYRGIWADEKEFMPENTIKDTFKGINGEKTVAMMQSWHKKRYYYADDDFESFNLYFGNGAFSLQIVLPSEELTLEEANKLLTQNLLDKFSKERVEVSLKVQIPKFKVNHSAKLNDIFAMAGIQNLNNVVNLKIFDRAESGSFTFRQSAAFEIDEKGIIVAAVSSGEQGFMAPLIPGGEYTVKIDRPFYFFLRDASTGACLLSGRIADL